MSANKILKLSENFVKICFFISRTEYFILQSYEISYPPGWRIKINLKFVHSLPCTVQLHKV